jgi:ferrous iron transport protein A
VTRQDGIKGQSPTGTGPTVMQPATPRGESTAAEIRIRPLSTVRTGETVRLVRVDAGRGLNSRLAAMGFVPDVKITVVCNGHPGPFVVIVKDVKMMLGRGAAHKIMVK